MRKHIAMLSPLAVKKIHLFRLEVAAFILLLVFQDIAIASEAVSAGIGSGEQLIAENVTASAPIWCGNEHLAVNIEVAAEETVPFIFDITENSRKEIFPPANLAGTSCSPDGKWLLLVKVDSNEKQYWRFNLETGKKELFALGYGGIWSPDGMRVLFTAKPYGRTKTIPQPEPQWNFYWKHEWGPGIAGSVAWLADSESLILARKEQFYLQRNKEITPLQLSIPNSWDEHIYVVELKTDQQGRVYALARVVEKSADKTSERISRRLLRCDLDIQHRKIKCDGLTTTASEVGVFDVSKDGQNLIYVDKKDHCLKLLSLSSGEQRCLVRNVSGSVAISPNSKNVAFSRFQEKRSLQGQPIVREALYVIQLK